MTSAVRRHTGAVAVSRSDKERMARLVEAFRAAETDDAPSTSELRAYATAANQWRVAHGIPEFENPDDTDPPELELYRRARALGLGKHSG